MCLIALIGRLAAAAQAPAPAPHAAMAEDGQASSRKYALDPDPSGAGWTQGSAPAQGGTSQSGLSATVLADTKYLLPDRPTAGTWPAAAPPAAAAAGSSASPESSARTEAIPPASTNFVQTDGIHFTLDGAIKYWSGSNDYFLILR